MSNPCKGKDGSDDDGSAAPAACASDAAIMKMASIANVNFRERKNIDDTKTIENPLQVLHTPFMKQSKKQFYIDGFAGGGVTGGDGDEERFAVGASSQEPAPVRRGER
jgi:hypothetical protein